MSNCSRRIWRFYPARRFRLPSAGGHLSDFVELELAAIESEPCRQYWNDVASDSTFTRLPRWARRLLPPERRVFALERSHPGRGVGRTQETGAGGRGAAQECVAGGAHARDELVERAN